MIERKHINYESGGYVQEEYEGPKLFKPATLVKRFFPNDNKGLPLGQFTWRRKDHVVSFIANLNSDGYMFSMNEYQMKAYDVADTELKPVPEGEHWSFFHAAILLESPQGKVETLGILENTADGKEFKNGEGGCVQTSKGELSTEEFSGLFEKAITAFMKRAITPEEWEASK